jgi:hypothetical protein
MEGGGPVELQRPPWYDGPVSAREPEQAVEEWLRRPRGVPQGTVRPGVSPRVAFVAWRGGDPFEVELSSVRILKSRATEHRRLYALTFRDTEGARWHWTLPVDAVSDGCWAARGGSGGGGATPLLAAYLRVRARLTRRRSQTRRPWVNLGGGNWPEWFYAGGRVEHDRGRAATVRLTCANGLVLTDSVDDGRVLFLTEQRAEVPVLAELLDHSGTVIGRHSAFDDIRFGEPPT